MKCTSKKIVGYWHYGVLLTYAALLLGVVGIIFSVMNRPGSAMLFLLASGLCDGFDGLVARTRKNRTIGDKSFGIQIDSLSDLVCFGVAPIMIGCAMGFKQWYFVVLYCVYVLCALVRLGHYNVKEIDALYKTETAQPDDVPDGNVEPADESAGRKPKKKYYEGMPVTNVSLVMPIFYFCATMAGKWSLPWAQVIMAVLYVLYAALMVIKFKMPKPRVKTLIVIITCFLVSITAFFLVRYFVCDVKALDVTYALIG